MRTFTTTRWPVCCARAFTCLLVPTLIPSCATEPITGRTTLAPIVPEATANELGESAYEQVLKEEQVSSNRRYHDLVNSVGLRIAEVTDRRMKQDGRTPYEWEFTVLEGPDVLNAFALPGGKVAFYSGILPVCGDEDGVAAVMAHEVAHAFAEHGRRRLSQSVLADVGLSAVQLALADEESSELSNLATAALGVGYQVGILLPFSSDDDTIDAEFEVKKD